MENDLIRRSDVLKILSKKDAPWGGFVNVQDLPAVDAVEVVHGWWRFDDFNGDGLDYTCSCCGLCSVDEYDYCPNCGAKMESCY